ncbi:GTP-binding protein At2g22870 [Linum grandiflorum]
MLLRYCRLPILPLITPPANRKSLLLSTHFKFSIGSFASTISPSHVSASKAAKPSVSDPAKSVRTVIFVPPGVELQDVKEDMILTGSNIVVGPYAGHSQIKEVEFVKSSARAKDCPKDDKPEFAILGRSNVGKSSLINSLVRKKEIALTSKKPGKTQLINHFLVNKSWYLVDLPGYGPCPFGTAGSCFSLHRILFFLHHDGEA